jgi:hypothetical protein
MLEAEDIPRERRAVRFAATFALLLCCLAAWALAMPMFSGTDEGAHIVRAYAVVHGEHTTIDPDTGRPVYQVPAVIVHGGMGDDPCFAFRPDQPADCMDLHSDGPRHGVESSATGYPPFFYALVGWPTLLNSGLTSLYLMRLCGAVIVALLLALAIENVARMRTRAPLVLGVAVAITPAVLYFGATVSPSGITVAAAFAVWTGGIRLVRSEPLDRIGWMAAGVGLPLCVLVLLRRDSVFWAALVVAGIIALTPRARRLVLIRSRAVWAWAAATVGCAVLQLVVSGAETGASVTSEVGGTGGDFWKAMGDAEWLAQQIQGGVLGSLDVHLPFPVLYIFVVSTGFLVIGAIGFASRRVSLTLLTMSLAVAFIPLAIGTIRFPYLQGRYMLPLTVGLPIVAGLGLIEGLRGTPLPRRILWLLFPILAYAQIHSFAQAMRRYVSGANADWWIFTKPRWQPPIGNPTVFVIFYTVAVVALFVWLYLLARPMPSGRCR